MPEPKVSIITPTYNHAAFIGSCIESVGAQTFGDWEMIVVDDGSTDGTADVVRSFADSRVRLLVQENRGVGCLGETYNRALAGASGSIVAILEGDDYWPSDRLERQVADFDDPQITLSAGHFQMVDENGAFLKQYPDIEPPREVRENTPTGRAAFGLLDPDLLTFTYPVTVAIRREALRSIGGFRQDPRLPLVDYTTFLPLSTTGRWRWHDDVLGMWRRHGGSVTKSRYPFILNAVYEYAVGFVSDRGKDLPITPEEWDHLDLKWQNFQLERLTLLARMLSADGKHREASALLSHAFTYDLRPRRRIAHRIASSLESMGRSADFIWRFANRESIREELRKRPLDNVVDRAMTAADFKRFSLRPNP